MSKGLVQGPTKGLREEKTSRRSDAPLAHPWPGYSSSGCVPAEPDSASPSIRYYTARAHEWRPDQKPTIRGLDTRVVMGASPQSPTPLHQASGIIRPERTNGAPTKNQRFGALTRGWLWVTLHRPIQDNGFNQRSIGNCCGIGSMGHWFPRPDG